MLTLSCDVQSGSSWKKVDIEYGLAHKGELMRCLECHGRVVPMKQYSTGAKAHFEHVTAHKGCSRPWEFSMGDQWLAMMQMGEPQPIATFNKWKEIGRHVKKGSKAIELLMQS